MPHRSSLGSILARLCLRWPPFSSGSSARNTSPPPGGLFFRISLPCPVRDRPLVATFRARWATHRVCAKRRNCLLSTRRGRPATLLCMDPRIEYATTDDGVSIAYATIGERIPLVNPPPALPWSNVQEEWQIPEWRHYYEHLNETFRIIRYDNRGAGLSTRDVDRIDLDTHILDLEAVVDRLGLDRFG